MISKFIQQCPILFCPYDYQPKGEDHRQALNKREGFGWKAIHTVKKGLAFASAKIDDISSIASFATHLDQVVPVVDLVCKNIFKEVIGKTTAGLCETAWLLGMVNSAHYFTSGLAEDLSKNKPPAFSIAAQVALLPTNILYIPVFLRASGIHGLNVLSQVSAKIGSIHVFKVVPWIAEKTQNLPLLRSFPTLMGKAQWVGKVQPLAPLGQIAIAPVFYTSLCAVYIFSCCHDVQKIVHHSKEIKLAHASATSNGDVEHIDYWQKRKQHREYKLSKDKWDLAAHLAKLTLTTIGFGSLVGVSACTAVAASLPTMAVLGSIALVCVGRNLYVSWNYQKPEKDPARAVVI
jgi:hypothetical protein